MKISLVVAIGTLFSFLISCLPASADFQRNPKRQANYDPEKAREILLQSKRQLQKLTAFSYSANYCFKGFDTNDTTRISYHKIELQRKVTDTVLGYYAHLIGNEDERMYNGNEFYLVYHTGKSIIRDRPAVSGKKFTRNNIRRELIPSFLVNPDPYSSYFDTSNKIDFKGRKKINGIDCYEISILFPGNDEITYYEQLIFINAKTLLPQRLIISAAFRNIQWEYTELSISNIQALEDQTQINYDLPDYTITDVKIPVIDYSLLDSNVIAPSIQLKDITGNLIQVKSLALHKLILLDFWYTGCSPCIKAIPKIIEIKRRFGSVLEVIGVNPVDTSVSQLAIIETLKNKLKINYPIAIAKREVEQLYKVKIYPTIYLIKDGKIIYGKAGYNETEFENLENIIKANMQ